MQKEVYVKRISEIDGLSVWLVNGRFIRDNINIEFTNYGHYYRFSFIPKTELWIDNPATPGEEKFFIERLAAEYRFMKNAAEKAWEVEKKLRDASLDPQEKVHQELLTTLSGVFPIWIVSGKAVRDTLDLDFTEGGNDQAYNFVPKKEIWIDDALQPDERNFVIFHELFERARMIEGLDYDAAHHEAHTREKELRAHPEKVEDALAEVVKLNLKYQ